MKAGVVVGYYSLTVSSAEHSECPSSVTAEMPGYPIPIILLARLAVHKDHQKQGIGIGLLKDAARKTVGVSERVGVRALVVDAKDEEARLWYLKNGFIGGANPMRLFAVIQDIRAALQP